MVFLLGFTNNKRVCLTTLYIYKDKMRKSDYIWLT